MISSSQNKIIKQVKALKTRKERDKTGLFLAEGLRFAGEIPKDYRVLYYVVSDSFAQNNNLAPYQARGAVHEVPEGLFKELSDTVSPQGILAVAEQKKGDLDKILCTGKKDYFFIIGEELNDPGNLGTIIRTADACNLSGVILTKGSVDVYNPKVLRSTMGSIFHLPIITDIALETCVEKLKRAGVSCYSAHLEGDCYPYHLNLRESCAFLIGNEARGLSDKAAELSRRLIKIPMPGQAESLNAAVAAGVLMYEGVRQRLGE